MNVHMYNTTVLRRGKISCKNVYIHTTRENLFFAFFHQPILTLPHPSSYHHNIVGEEMDRREKKVLSDDATMTEFNFIHG